MFYFNACPVPLLLQYLNSIPPRRNSFAAFWHRLYRNVEPHNIIHMNVPVERTVNMLPSSQVAYNFDIDSSVSARRISKINEDGLVVENLDHEGVYAKSSGGLTSDSTSTTMTTLHI